MSIYIDVDRYMYTYRQTLLMGFKVDEESLTPSQLSHWCLPWEYFLALSPSLLHPVQFPACHLCPTPLCGRTQSLPTVYSIDITVQLVVNDSYIPHTADGFDGWRVIYIFLMIGYILGPVLISVPSYEWYWKWDRSKWIMWWICIEVEVRG